MRPVASLSLCLLPDLMHQPLAQILLRMRHRQVPWDRRVLEDVMTAGNADLSPARFLEFPKQLIAFHWWLSYPPKRVAVNVAQSINRPVETCMTTNTHPTERDAAARNTLRRSNSARYWAILAASADLYCACARTTLPLTTFLLFVCVFLFDAYTKKRTLTSLSHMQRFYANFLPSKPSLGRSVISRNLTSCGEIGVGGGDQPALLSHLEARTLHPLGDVG
jgi:hypothetical protein